MITAFKAGTRVQNRKGTHKTVGVITDGLKSWDWRIPGYLGDGFYEVKVGDMRGTIVAHEDDLELVPEYHGA